MLDTFKPRISKGSIGHAFAVRIRTENQDQASFCPFTSHEVSVLAELALGHLRYPLKDVPPQPSSPPETVLGADRPHQKWDLVLECRSETAFRLTESQSDALAGLIDQLLDLRPGGNSNLYKILRQVKAELKTIPAAVTPTPPLTAPRPSEPTPPTSHREELTPAMTTPPPMEMEEYDLTAEEEQCTFEALGALIKIDRGGKRGKRGSKGEIGAPGAIGIDGPKGETMLQKAFKDDCISRSQSGKWHKAFKEGREEVADEPRSGRPTTARTDENVDRVLEVLRTDRRLSIQQIADTLHMSTLWYMG
ncbi:hypothetical protein LAZ67_23001833 [Cordylochernes scorpioides]|uniref:Uncharacterized protein n=1 Tax=Cordylochernes scorpioides TaxID=51811 RepID=A0ABY6LR07_9ARAC|nr:hypothetical protein LAZ67_23001833 [Cordylochernes scorpioides]